jgi:hypothetical protein
MQREAKQHVRRNRNFRPAVHSITDQLRLKAHNSKLPIKVEIKDFWEKQEYMDSTNKRTTTGVESYIAAQVMKRLRRKHNMCVVPIIHAAFLRSMPVLLKLNVDKTTPYVSTGPGRPATGMYVSYVADGNFPAAYERVNSERQILARARAFKIRAERELKANRLSKPAKAAVLQDAKKLVAELSIQLRLPY